MQRIAFDPAATSCLRFVFGDRVLSLDVAADVTFGEIARRLGELSSRRYSSPVGIDVTLGAVRTGRMEPKQRNGHWLAEARPPPPLRGPGTDPIQGNKPVAFAFHAGS